MAKGRKANNQAKIVQKMRKDLYSESDKYLIIGNPYGLQPDSPVDQAAVNRIAAWVSTMLGRDGIVDTLYYHRNKSEVIVQLAINLNIESMLGAHKRGKFLSKGWAGAPGDPNEVSTVFQYNFQRSGEPEEHGWKALCPEQVAIPEGMLVSPYPPPSWAVPPPTLSILALPLPKTRERSPTPKLEEIKQEVKQEQPAFTTNLDPYEQEDEVARFLRTVPIPPSVKPEPEEPYQPSQELVDAVHTLSQRLPSSSSSVKQELAVKHEEAPYQPSQELLDAFASLSPQVPPVQNSAIFVKPEPGSDNIPSLQFIDYPLAPASVVVKPDPDTAYQPDADLQAAFGELQSLRVSPPLQSPRIKSDPDASSLAHQTPQTTPAQSSKPAVKAEATEYHFPRPRTSNNNTSDPRLPTARPVFPSFKKNKRPVPEGDSKESVKRAHI